MAQVVNLNVEPKPEEKAEVKYKPKLQPRPDPNMPISQSHKAKLRLNGLIEDGKQIELPSSSVYHPLPPFTTNDDTDRLLE